MYKAEIEIYKKNQLVSTGLMIEQCRAEFHQFDKMCGPDEKVIIEMEKEINLLRGRVKALEKENSNLKENLGQIQER